MTAVLDVAVMRVGEDGCARFTFGRSPRLVAGRQRVAQHFIFGLLTKPGSIFTTPNYGGGLLHNVPTAFKDESELHVSVAAAVSKTVRDIMAEQAQHVMEPPDRLASVKILEARLDTTRGVVTYYLKLEIKTEAGESEIVEL